MQSSKHSAVQVHALMNARLWKKALWIMSSIFLCWGYGPALGNAADNPQTYTDGHGYFSFTPPPGWVEKDFPGESRDEVRLHFS